MRHQQTTQQQQQQQQQQDGVQSQPLSDCDVLLSFGGFLLFMGAPLEFSARDRRLGLDPVQTGVVTI